MLFRSFVWYALLLTLYLLSASDSCTGQINIGQLHILPGTTWVSNTGTTVVLDNMDLQYDANPVLLNNTFRFTGTRINSIRGEKQPLLYAISVAKDDPGELTVNQDINVTKRINFEKGMFDLNRNGIFLQPDAVLTNENENSRLVGPFGGYISIEADLHAPVAINPGNLGAFITSATDLGKVTVSRMHDLQTLNDSSQSIARWYSISIPGAGTLSAGLRFNYFYSESEGFHNDSLVLWQHGDNTDWDDIGYTTRDASQKYVEKQGLTRLSVFTLAPGPSTSSIIPPPPPPPGSPQFILKLYPTIAVGGRVYIAVGNMPLAKMSFMIVDAKGCIVLTGDLPYQSQWLPVHFLSHGVYRLILRSGGQHWHSTFIR